ncbi:unnamed protein product [Rhizophagus irregularis]|nr:unnamed protein product [Rhizophagus irregularis]CAB5362857.1 unnamed protein product [Rhizophagus irregularis]
MGCLISVIVCKSKKERSAVSYPSYQQGSNSDRAVSYPSNPQSSNSDRIINYGEVTLNSDGEFEEYKEAYAMGEVEIYAKTDKYNITKVGYKTYA